MLRHPVMYAGQIRRFALRVRKDSLAQVVDTFSDAVTIVPDSEMEETVDLWVDANDGAMKFWLLQYGDVVEAIDLPDNFAAELKKCVEALSKIYL